MAITNFTSGGRLASFDRLLCTEEATAGIKDQLVFLSVVHIVLSISAFLGNALIQVALHKESSLHPPTKLLLRTLSASDLFTGVIGHPIAVILLLSLAKERWNICLYAINTATPVWYFLGKVSLFILTVISVDRLFALLLKLRYRQVVTLKRTWVTVITICTLSTIPSTMYFWNENISMWFGTMVTALCLLISAFSYTKIFFKLRQHHSRAHDQALQQPASLAGQLNIARYRKAVYNALWLQLTLVVCYLPYGIAEVLWLIQEREFSSSMYLAAYIAVTFALLNSSLNPILYCWKIREVRQAVKVTLRHILCLSS